MGADAGRPSPIYYIEYFSFSILQVPQNTLYYLRSCSKITFPIACLFLRQRHSNETYPGHEPGAWHRLR